MAIRLRVSSGPEIGRAVVFDEPVVTIGRGRKNDLVLQDGRISQYHGEVVRREGKYIYRDLMSRHGTLILGSNQRRKLHNRKQPQEIALEDGSRMVLGETALTVEFSADVDNGFKGLVDELSRVGRTDTRSPERKKSGEQILTRTYDSLDAVARRLSSQDPRLVSIFRLSRSLNAVTDLDQVLDLIIESTFEAFPAANFFAISLIPQQAEPYELRDVKTLITRVREGRTFGNSKPLLSRSLLQKVANSQESVLFVRDHAKTLSESIINARITACLAAPLVGQRKLIGVMQADTRGLGGLFGSDDLDLFTVMASYAAFAIERGRLNTSIHEMFGGIVRASTKAIDERDPSTAGHSERVATLCIEMARSVNEVGEGRLADVELSDAELRELRYAALLHDFGKIGVRESILTKEERLYPLEQDLLRERFETIKALRSYHLLNDALEKLVREACPLTQEHLEDLRSDVEDISRETEAMINMLLERQRIDRLSHRDKAKYREMASQTVTNLEGDVLPYIPSEILHSLEIPSGTLTHAEWVDMMSHASRSRDYLRQIPWSSELERVPSIAGGHHEKLDGSGYPDGICSESIPIQVRILTICDMFDALTAIDRPYRKALTIEAALELIESEADEGRVDGDLANVLKSVILRRTKS